MLEADGQPRAGKLASEQLIDLCDRAVHEGWVAWHSLPMVTYYYRRQNSAHDTAAMIDLLLSVFQVPTVSHQDAQTWRNTADFRGILMPVMTPEQFLASSP